MTFKVKVLLYMTPLAEAVEEKPSRWDSRNCRPKKWNDLNVQVTRNRAKLYMRISNQDMEGKVFSIRTFLA